MDLERTVIKAIVTPINQNNDKTYGEWDSEGIYLMSPSRAQKHDRKLMPHSEQDHQVITHQTYFRKYRDMHVGNISG